VFLGFSLTTAGKPSQFFFGHPAGRFEPSELPPLTGRWFTYGNFWPLSDWSRLPAALGSPVIAVLPACLTVEDKEWKPGCHSGNNDLSGNAAGKGGYRGGAQQAFASGGRPGDRHNHPPSSPSWPAKLGISMPRAEL